MNAGKKRYIMATVLMGELLLTGCGSDGTEQETDKATEQNSQKATTELVSDLITQDKQTEEQTTEIPTTKEQETTAVPDNNVSKESIPFPKSAFLGASRTEGLRTYGVVSEADFYTAIGTTVKDVVGKENFVLQDGSKGTMLQAVSEKEYDKIYLMFGINELGWPTKEGFKQYYGKILTALKERYPEGKIYVQSILPMVEAKTDATYNNDKIRTFNTYLEEIAQENSVNYVDVGMSVMDKDGALPENASNDGIHLKKDYLFKWAEYLKEKTQG